MYYEVNFVGLAEFNVEKKIGSLEDNSDSDKVFNKIYFYFKGKNVKSKYNFVVLVKNLKEVEKVKKRMTDLAIITIKKDINTKGFPNKKQLSKILLNLVHN